MTKLESAKQILKELDVPERQQSNLCAYTLLALAGITETAPWKTAGNDWMRIHDVLDFLRNQYGADYAENSREIIRKQAMHHFRRAAFIEDNGTATNSPNYRYRLTEEMLALLRSYGTNTWASARASFLAAHSSLAQQYENKRNFKKMPVRINGGEFHFSTGRHNQLQKAILEEFAPRFAPGSVCLYVGDTTNKDLVKNTNALAELGFSITLHDKMPDVVLYLPEKRWLFFVEAVTSVGPMSPERIKELSEMTAHVKAGKIFVTAFLDFRTYKKFSACLSWDTEVWIAEAPDHMIHLNGDRFIGPR